MSYEKIYIVIPAYNEEKVILEVIKGVRNHGFNDIILVDDGSSDNTRQKASEAENITVLRHKINRGKGAATKTGIEAAKLLGADIIVTMDGDGQHDPKDINGLINPIINEGFDVVLGTRIKNSSVMPFHRILLNHMGNLFTWFLFGLWVTDSQSGFRAYSKKAFETINTRYDGYEYESEIIREIYVHKLKYKEVPIKTLYTDYSIQKGHGQNFLNGAKTLYRMLLKLIH